MAALHSCGGGFALLGLLVGLGGSAWAQSPQPKRFLAVKAVPQQLVMGGYWLEVEYGRRAHPRQSFTLTPQFYHGAVGRPDVETSTAYSPNREESVRGLGLAVQHRLYIGGAKTNYPSGWYVSYGGHFQHFQMRFQRPGWHEVEGPNGLPLTEYGLVHYTETINRYGVAAGLGYQAPLPPGRVFLDVYAGVGVRQSHSQSPFADSQYRSGGSDYAHRGVYFPAGLKVGVMLR